MFRDPRVAPSTEAAHTALLFAQVAWNRTLVYDAYACKELLKTFLRSSDKEGGWQGEAGIW